MTEIRPLAAGDRLEWEQFYRGNANFYRVETSAHKLTTLFGWLINSAHTCKGLVTVGGDRGLACFANYRAIPSPLRGAEGGFLDDLFVDPYQRGDGTGEALVRCVDEITAKHGWGVVRWITGDNN